MPAIDKLIYAVHKGRRITSVRFRHRPDEMHTVVQSRDGKVALQLGKTVTPAELWMAKQTQRFRKFGTNARSCTGPNPTAHIKSVEVYCVGRGWMPLVDLPAPPGASRRHTVSSCAGKTSVPTGAIHRQVASGKGPDAIASSATYQALLSACKESGIPSAGPIATKVDMATALIVCMWKKATGCSAV